MVQMGVTAVRIARALAIARSIATDASTRS
jgi:hypothetical protein